MSVLSNINAGERLPSFANLKAHPPIVKRIFQIVSQLLSSFTEKLTPSPDSLLRRVFYFSLPSAKRSQLKCTDNPVSSPHELYGAYADIMREHGRGQGTCPLRAFASIESLTSGKIHIYEHNARVLVTPKAFEEYYGVQDTQKKFQPINSETLNHFPDGQIFLFARPLPGRFGNFLNRLFGFQGNSSQISHFCVGAKINGKNYAWDLNREPALVFEKLGDHQFRLQKKRNMPKINLFLPVGLVHKNVDLSPPVL